MTAVYRPLLVSELVRLLELPSQIESLPKIEKCLLLEVQSGIVKFINPAAQQVTRQRLHEDATLFPQLHSQIAKKSLKFLSAHFKIAALSFPRLNLGPSQSEKEMLPGAYGTLHWIMHLINVEDIVKDDEMVDLVVSFMKNHFLLWLDTLASEGLHADAAILMKRLESVLLEQKREEKSERLKTQDFDQSERQRLEQLGENKQSHILSLVRDGVQLFRLHTSENSLSRKHPSSAIFYPEESALKQDWMAKNKDWLVEPPRMTHSWSNIPFILNASHSNSIAFSPDGRLLATGLSFGICLWDAETGAAQLNNEHESLRNRGDYLAFSAGGQLASAAKNGTVDLWDLSTGRSLKTFQVEQGDITAIRFSPNADEGEKLILATSDALLLWKFSDFGKPTCKYTEEVIEEEGHVSAVDFSQQGTWIASGAAGGDIKIWDARHGNVLHKTIQGHKECINSVAFSQDEKRLVSGSGDLTVKIWSVETGANLSSFDCEFTIRAVAFSPDGSFIAAGFGNEVKVWEIAFLPQGRLASGSSDTTIQLWDFEGSVSNDTNALSDFTSCSSISHITMSPDGKYLASTSGKNIHLRDGTTDMPMESNELLQDGVTSISFSPDGKRLVSSSEDGLVRVWDVVEGSLYRTFEGHSQRVTFATFSPDGNSIASASDDRTVRIWSCLPEAEGGDAIVLEGHEDRVTTVAFSPDGRLLVSVSPDSNIIVWDCKSRRPKYSVTGQSGIITTIVFSQDSSRIVSRSTNRTIYVWDSNTGDLIQGPIIIRWPGRNVGFDPRMPEYILTEYGADPSTLEHSPFLVEECQKGGRYGVALGNDWITWNGREIISIPKMYRPTASWVQGNIVAIGTRLGEVLLFRFSTEVEPPN
ncbi:WD40-repeat-containing domain protein [Trichoderma camerunense]